MKRSFPFAALILSLALLLAACSGGPGGGGAIELTDDADRAVSLAKTPEKIIALMPSDVEILYALGAQDKLIAIGEYCNYPADTANKQSVGTGENTSVEQMIALKPDLIIMGIMAQQIEHVQALESAGIPIMIINAQTIESTYSAIEKIGLVSGKTSEAAALIKQMKDGFTAISKKAEDEARKTAYVEVSPLAYGLYTCGNGTFIGEILEIAGVDNVFGDLEGWPGISEEQIIAHNPDVILTTSNEATGLGDPIAEICGRAGWGSIAAVQSGAVALIDSDSSTRPGPRLVEAAQAIYDIVYGK